MSIPLSAKDDLDGLELWQSTDLQPLIIHELALLCVRQIQVISRFDEQYETLLGESLVSDDYDMDPLPVIF